MQAIDYERRFGGVSRLYGSAGARAISEAHVIVVGVGGVGSWAAEAMARTDVRRITLIDLDNVAESNTNRQIQALNNEFGKAKIRALAERFALINPRASVEQIEEFVDADNVAELIAPGAFVIDCIDQVRAKAAMIAHCRKIGNWIVTCGAAGGRVDPTRIQVGDLGRLKGDPLLSNVRYRLRKEYGFPAVGHKTQPAPFRIPAVFSDEPVKRPEGASCDIHVASGLQCAGYGSGVVVTASLGMSAAALCLNEIVRQAA